MVGGHVSDDSHGSVAIDRVGAITLFVDDLAGARAWYSRAFERPVVLEDEQSVVFQFENTLVKLLHRSAAHELIAPRTVGESNRPSQFQLTIWVDDVVRMIESLSGRGIETFNGPIDRPWGQRTACLVDPDGHVWELAQALD
jgi:lactoylglutathione lyase